MNELYESSSMVFDLTMCFHWIHVTIYIGLRISSWWFQICFIFTPNPGEMIQFDDMIFLNWIGSTTNSIYLEVFQLLMDFWGMVGLPHFFPPTSWPGWIPRGIILYGACGYRVSILLHYFIGNLWHIYSFSLIYFIHIYIYLYYFIGYDFILRLLNIAESTFV